MSFIERCSLFRVSIIRGSTVKGRRQGRNGTPNQGCSTFEHGGYVVFSVPSARAYGKYIHESVIVSSSA